MMTPLMRLVTHLVAVGAVLTALSAGHATALGQSSDGGSGEEPHPPNAEEPVRYGETLPGSRIRLDADLVEEANAAGTRAAQVKLLIGILPDPSDAKFHPPDPSDAAPRRLNARQMSAVRMLGLTHSERAVRPLLSILEFEDERGHTPVPPALGDLGKVAEDDVLEYLKQDGLETQTVVTAVVALRFIVGNESLADIAERRGDEFPEDVVRWLRTLAREH